MTKSRITRYSIKHLLSHSTEKHRRGTLLCFRKFLVSKIFLDRIGAAGEREVASHFSVKCFCLTAAEKIVEEHFSVSLNSGSDNFFAQDGYVSICCRKLLSDSAEDFRRGSLSCFKKFLVSKFSVQEGFVTFFKRVFFRLAVPKNVVAESFSRSINSVMEKFFASEGKITLS